MTRRFAFGWEKRVGIGRRLALRRMSFWKNWNGYTLNRDVGMLDFVVFSGYAFLLFQMFFGKRELQYIWLLLCVVLFPPCIYFSQSPQVSPLQLCLYSFLFICVFIDVRSFGKSLLGNPMVLPLCFLLISLVLCVFVNRDGFKGYYNAGRLFIENYSYWLLAFYAGTHYREIVLERRLFYPILICVGLVMMEIVLSDNIAFKTICSAFPYYDGLYNLDGTVSALRSYRIRSMGTSVHPTAWGAMCMCTLLFYAGCAKKLPWGKIKKIIIWMGLLSLILLSGSRTAWLCSALGLFILAFPKFSPVAKICCIVAIIGFVALGVGKVVNSLNIEGQGSSLSMRKEQILFSYVQFMKSPIVGNGVRYTSKYIMERDAYNDRVIDDEIGGLESVVFYQLIDYGLFGLASYCFMFIFAIAYFIRHRAFKYACPGMAIAFSFGAFAILSGEIGSNNIFAYLLVGYCMGAVSQQKNLTKDDAEEERGI